MAREIALLDWKARQGQDPGPVSAYVCTLQRCTERPNSTAHACTYMRQLLSVPT